MTTATAVVHHLSVHATAFGWGWGCSCGKSGSGNSARSADAAHGYGERHIANERRRATIAANAVYYSEYKRSKEA